jgi:hypothetical protein
LFHVKRASYRTLLACFSGASPGRLRPLNVPRETNARNKSAHITYYAKRVEDVTMIVAFVAVIVAGVAAPFFVYA